MFCLSLSLVLNKIYCQLNHFMENKKKYNPPVTEVIELKAEENRPLENGKIYGFRVTI